MLTKEHFKELLELIPRELDNKGRPRVSVVNPSVYDRYVAFLNGTNNQTEVQASPKAGEIPQEIR